jgi:hypothetical protein
MSLLVKNPPRALAEQIAAEESLLQCITRLGNESLREKDIDRAIELLIGRNTLAIASPIEESSLSLAEMQLCLQVEVEVLNRLEQERKKLLKQMEELSSTRKACQRYQPKFPFPPTPAFFDTTT